jgi:hypothetical protein
MYSLVENPCAALLIEKIPHLWAATVIFLRPQILCECPANRVLVPLFLIKNNIKAMVTHVTHHPPQNSVNIWG